MLDSSLCHYSKKLRQLSTSTTFMNATSCTYNVPMDDNILCSFAIESVICENIAGKRSDPLYVRLKGIITADLCSNYIILMVLMNYPRSTSCFHNRHWSCRYVQRYVGIIIMIVYSKFLFSETCEPQFLITNELVSANTTSITCKHPYYTIHVRNRIVCYAVLF